MSAYAVSFRGGDFDDRPPTPFIHARGCVGGIDCAVLVRGLHGTTD
jgi:hypothetical protein